MTAPAIKTPANQKAFIIIKSFVTWKSIVKKLFTVQTKERQILLTCPNKIDGLIHLSEPVCSSAYIWSINPALVNLSDLNLSRYSIICATINTVIIVVIYNNNGFTKKIMLQRMRQDIQYNCTSSTKPMNIHDLSFKNLRKSIYCELNNHIEPYIKSRANQIWIIISKKNLLCFYHDNKYRLFSTANSSRYRPHLFLIIIHPLQPFPVT